MNCIYSLYVEEKDSFFMLKSTIPFIPTENNSIFFGEEQLEVCTVQWLDKEQFLEIDLEGYHFSYDFFNYLRKYGFIENEHGQWDYSKEVKDE